MGAQTNEIDFYIDASNVARCWFKQSLNLKLIFILTLVTNFVNHILCIGPYMCLLNINDPYSNM